MINDALLARRRDEIHAVSFSPTEESHRVGAEVELLALDEQTLKPIPLLSGKSALVSTIRSYGSPRGWREIEGYGAVPKFEIRG